VTTYNHSEPVTSTTNSIVLIEQCRRDLQELSDDTGHIGTRALIEWCDAWLNEMEEQW
jgi:hypothetical protein